LFLDGNRPGLQSRAMTTMRSGLLLTVLLVFTSTRARAGNDDEILLGNDAALMGGAVVAHVNDGSALWYNPAGLGRATRNSVDVGASAFTLRRYNYPSMIRVEDGSNGDASFTEFVTIPSALTYLRRFSSRVVGSLGLFASEFNDFTLRTAASLEAPGGEARLSMLMTGEVARYHLMGGVGIRLPHGLTFGVALSGDYQSDSEVSHVAVTSQDGRETLYAFGNTEFAQYTTLGFHLRAGLTYEPRPWVRLGLSIETPGMYFYRSGRSTEFIIDASQEPELDAQNNDETERLLTLGLYAPVRMRFGAAFLVGGGVVSLEGDVSSKVHDSEVEIDRVLTWNLRAGARFPISERYRIGAGVFTDRAPERKDEVGAGRVDFYGGTVGVQYENVHLLAGKDREGQPRGGLTFASTVALRYAYGSGKEYGIDIDSDGDLSGRPVSMSIHEVTLHLGSGIYF
jgi:hypothetical protein